MTLAPPSTGTPARLLVSGPTGQLGSAMARHLAGAGADAVFVGRRRNAASLGARVRGLLPGLALEPDRLVEGDVGADRWGLGDRLADLNAPDVVLNLAACTDWSAPWSHLYRANAVSPVEALRLAGSVAAASGREVLVVHIGSALGTYAEERWVSEALHPLAPHATDYERSKWMGEQRFLAGRPPEGVKRVLVRVTGIIGGTDGAPLARRHGPYLYLRASSASGVNVLPCNRNGRVDMVPADVAATTLGHIVANAHRTPDGTVLHLALGETAPTIGTVVDVLNDARGVQGRPRLRTVPLPRRVATRGADVVDRLVPLSQRTRNMLIGLRYFSLDRFFSRTNLEAVVGRDHLPRLDLDLLADVLLERRDGERFTCADAGPCPTRPFEVFHG